MVFKKVVKAIGSVLIYAWVSSFGFCGIVLATTQTEQITEAVVNFLQDKMNTRPQVKDFTFDEHLGLYVIRLMVPRGLELIPIVAYVTKDAKFITLGRWFDLKTGEDLTQTHMVGFVPQRVKVDPSTLREGPFLGNGPIALTFVGSPRCPHCRDVFHKVVELTKTKQDKFSLAYFGLPDPHNLEREKLITCLRIKKPDLFWDFLLWLYSNKDSEPASLQEWLKQKGVDLNLCEDVQVVQKKVPFNAVPVLVLSDGTILLGSDEINKFVKEHER